MFHYHTWLYVKLVLRLLYIKIVLYICIQHFTSSEINYCCFFSTFCLQYFDTSDCVIFNKNKRFLTFSMLTYIKIIVLFSEIYHYLLSIKMRFYNDSCRCDLLNILARSITLLEFYSTIKTYSCPSPLPCHAFFPPLRLFIHESNISAVHQILHSNAHIVITTKHTSH